MPEQTSTKDERLRVIHLLERLDEGETERQLLLLLKNYNSLRFIYVVVAFEAGSGSPIREQIERLGIIVLTLPENCDGFWQRYKALRELVEPFKPHLVHSWGFRTNLYAGVVGRLVGAAVRLGSWREPTSLVRAGRVARFLALRSVDRCIVPRHDLAAEVVRRGLGGRRAILLEHAVEAMAPSGALDLTHLGIGPKARLVGMAGAFDDGDDVKTFVDAMARLIPRHADLYALVVGHPAAPPPRVVADIEEHIAQQGLEGRVFITGPQEDLFLLLARFEAFCVTAAGLDLPLTILRAMAARTPVVGVRAGSLPDLVRDGENGMLVEPGDAASMAEGVDLILSDRRLAGQLGHSARRAVVHARGSHRMARHLEDLYCELLAEAWDQEWEPDEEDQTEPVNTAFSGEFPPY